MSHDNQSEGDAHAHAEGVALHVYDGIVELDNPLPRWWLWTFVGTVIFAAFYWMWQHSLPHGVSSWDNYGEAQLAFDLDALANAIDPATIETMAGDEAAVARGATIYQNKCAACHGADGSGSVGPNLTDPNWIHGGDLRAIYITVAGGYPKLGMPEWRAVLEDSQLAEVVAFLLSIRDTNRPGRPPQGEIFVGELVPPATPPKAPPEPTP